MMLAQLLPDMVKDVAPWLISLGAVLWITNEGMKFFKSVRGEPPSPPNGQLGAAHAVLSGRTSKNENSIRTLYGQVAQLRTDFTHELQEQTQIIIASGERRHEAITRQFQEIAAAIARLDERTKH